MVEVWRDIDGYEGYYQVSNLGKVRRLDAYINTEILNNTKRLHKGGLLTLNSRARYKTVALSKDGKAVRHLVHRLVAQAFLPNPNNYPVINHKDENPSNNVVWVNEDGSVDFEKSNLEWCTQKHNMNWNGVMKRKVGPKLMKSEEEKKENRRRYLEAHKEERREMYHRYYLRKKEYKS